MQPHSGKPDRKPYLRLLVALATSYLVMFATMYSRVDELGHVFLSLNQVYMAGLMVAPMLLIMLTVMHSMFQDRRLNAVLYSVGVALTLLFWILVRTQAGVGDRQFLRSMIPHHSGAILVCEEAALTDSRTQELCRQIIDSQQREIREMKALLGEAR